jgi:ribosomal protein S18 acetylase RimI-like enzyme
LSEERIDVRKCRPEDVVPVLELWAQERSAHASTPDRAEDVERLIGDSPAALLVAEWDGEIVGALIAGWDGWRGNMYRLAVSREHRRRGIGLELTRAGEGYLRGCGAGRITALVAFDDEEAGAFWGRCRLSDGSRDRSTSPQPVGVARLGTDGRGHDFIRSRRAQR